MKKICTIVFILGWTSCLMAQKTIEKQWDMGAIDTLLIESNAIYRISITTDNSERIRLSARVEGEYYESVVLNSTIRDRSLRLTTGFSPYFRKDNDKLAAHKVLSIEVSLDLPEGMAVVIRSKSASVGAEGKLAYLETVLSEGTIVLSNFMGDARLFSTKGDIIVDAGFNVGGRGNSTSGTVKTTLPLEGDYFIEASSVRGNVILRNK